MRKSYKIALSGICTALSVIFLTLAFFFEMASISFYILAALVLLLPLSKKMYGYTVLIVIASALFSLLLGWIGLFIPYVLFFGIHPILTVGLKNIKKLNKYIAMVIKQVLFNGMFFLIYLITKNTFFPSIENLTKLGWLWLIIIVLNLLLFIYDQVFLTFAKRAEYYVDKFTKSK